VLDDLRLLLGAEEVGGLEALDDGVRDAWLRWLQMRKPSSPEIAAEINVTTPM
jgi:hypothetical protein